MTLSIAVANGKGGVTKSTIARALVTEFTRAGWNTLGLDMDVDQGTLIGWNQQRLRNEFEPNLNILGVGTNTQFKKHIASEQWDLIVADAAAYASKSILEVASFTDMLILPTRYTDDDLRTTVRTIYSILDAGNDLTKLAVVFSSASDKPAERVRAVNYLKESGVFIVDEFIPNKDSYYQAMDKGLAITEMPIRHLRERAKEVITKIGERFAEITTR